MGLFNKGKDSKKEVQTLSEKNIQEKLYGSFHKSNKLKSSVVVEDNLPDFKTPPFSGLHPKEDIVEQDQVTPVEASRQSHEALEEQVGAEDLFSQPAQEPEQEIEEVPYEGYESAEALPEVREEVESLEEKDAPQEDNANVQEEWKDAQSEEDETEEEAGEELEDVKPWQLPPKDLLGSDISVSKYVKRSQTTESKWVPSPQPKKWTAPSINWQSYIKKIGGKLKEFGFIVVSALFAIPKFFINYYRHHQKGVKKTLGFVAIAVALFVLFSSVHYLNEQREQAMSETRKDVTQSAVVEGQSRTDESIVAQSPSSESPLSAAESSSQATDAEEVANFTSATLGRYVVQIATFVAETDAERTVKNLQEKGWKSFHRVTKRSSGKTYFPVYLGRFADYSQAKNTFEKFKASADSNSYKDAFIRTLKASS